MFLMWIAQSTGLTFVVTLDRSVCPKVNIFSLMLGFRLIEQNPYKTNGLVGQKMHLIENKILITSWKLL